MSRFFKALSDSESDSSESDNEVVAKAAPAPQAQYYSDDEEDTKRVVRTAKEKRFEELNDLIRQIKNHKKIKDFAKLLTTFDNLTKAHSKAKAVIEKSEKGVTPRFFIKILVELSDFIDETWEDKELRKNMNKNNSKSLTTIRQKVRKFNKDFEGDMTKYRENPDEEKEEEEEEDSEAESGSESDEDSEGDSDESDGEEKEKPEKADKKKPAASSSFLKSAAKDDDSESDDSDWASSEDSDSSDGEDYTGANMADFFKKKEGQESKKTEKKEKKVGKKPRLREPKEEDDEAWQMVDGPGALAQEKVKLFGKDDEINHETVINKIHDVIVMRGKKRIHRAEQLSLLKELMEICETHKLGPAIQIRLLFAIVSNILSYNSNVNSCMKVYNWKECIAMTQQMLEVLVTNKDTLSVGEQINEESESYVTAPFRVSGCPLTLIERVDEEFTRMLQSVDAHSPEYIERLMNERVICEIIDKLVLYLEMDKKGTTMELCRAYIMKIDHLYYKFDPIAMDMKDLKEKVKKGEMTEEEAAPTTVITSLDIINKLCTFIYTHDKTDRTRTQAILFHIYHHSLHDNFFEARDLMLMSHLQHNIQKADIPLHIIFNRALVQLGLCAFRHGNIRDAHTALLDIQIMGRAKELLAQGIVPRAMEKTAEQEKMEKRRLLPFHKHINLELLECVYLVSAMLLEIPDVAANEFSIRKKMISRSFYNQLRKYEEQPLVGLPESMREHVVAASKAMRVGNWNKCVEFIINQKMNNKVWNLFHRPDNVREMLVRKIREESLRAYLFTYSHVYDSISLDTLSQMLDLDKPTVHSIVSKMMTNEELMTSLDEPTQTLIMHRTEPSRIQGLSLQLTEKINFMVEQNERLWEVKQMGTYGNTASFGNKNEYSRGKNWTERLGYDNRRGEGGRRGGRYDGARRQGGGGGGHNKGHHNNHHSNKPATVEE